SGLHHETLDDLKHAALGNCQICTVLYDRVKFLDIAHKLQSLSFEYSFDAYHDGSFEMSPFRILRLSSSDAGPLIKCEFCLIPLNGSGDRKTAKADLMQSSGLGGQQSGLGNNVPGNLGDPVLMDLASKWLRTCLREHRKCAAAQDPLWYPKRLLDLSATKSRLILTAEEKLEGGYATLSHCWGKDPSFHVLTADNVLQMQVEIHSVVLPATFRDAITVCRRLNIRYLWIDSLCILQRGTGSVEDWQEHAIAMRKVYANGLLNISADCATCADEGFFRDRNPYLIRPAESPIAKRGWVLQERLLSPRVLHFTSRQLLWECSSLVFASEAFPTGLPGRQVQSTENLAPFKIDDASQGFSNSWYRLLRDYTARQLSKPFQDKFIALAGIVERINEIRKDEYVAGFFRTDLPYALLWANAQPLSDCALRSNSTQGYRAPTWSWASTDTPVTFDMVETLRKFDHTLYATIIDTSVSLINKTNKAGQISDAKLVLQASVVSIAWDVLNYQEKGARLYIAGSAKSTCMDGAVSSGIFDDPETDANPIEGAIAALFIANNAKSLDHIFYVGLILAPIDAQVEQQYRRVGVWLDDSGECGFGRMVEAGKRTAISII
ncbi:HET-domain-containing protein, partial [Glonium stellatum]